MNDERRWQSCHSGDGIQISGGRVYLFLKRLLDIVGSILAAVFFAPLFLITFLAEKLDDPRAPAFYGHVRVGENGKLFKCWKFRSMVMDAERVLAELAEEQKLEYAITFKLKDDPRVTKLGRFIRETSIDEIPQIYNIIAGDMSLVGPRPVVSDEVGLYGDCAWVLTRIKPGLTGYWQVHGRSDTTYEERVMMDVHYAQNRSMAMDLGIMAKTVIRVIRREGAC